MKLTDTLLEHPLVYRLWQAPFANAKLAPVRRSPDFAGARRVLDVGCGPGTNAATFAGRDYLGIDLEERYVMSARRRHGPRFRCLDARELAALDEPPFDLVLVNSLLHHLDDAGAARVLGSLPPLMTSDARVHLLDLVLPEGPSIARFLARHDRGDFPRPEARWRELFEAVFRLEDEEAYALRMAGVPLWRMIHLRGRKRDA